MIGSHHVSVPCGVIGRNWSDFVIRPCLMSIVSQRWSGGASKLAWVATRHAEGGQAPDVDIPRWTAAKQRYGSAAAVCPPRSASLPCLSLYRLPDALDGSTSSSALAAGTRSEQALPKAGTKSQAPVLLSGTGYFHAPAYVEARLACCSEHRTDTLVQSRPAMNWDNKMTAEVHPE